MIKFILIFLLIASSINAKPVLKWTGPRHNIIDNYLKIHKEYSNRLCRGSDHEYLELLKAYRGNGVYVPVISDAQLDKETIVNNISLINDKINWIEEQKKQLEKIKNFKSIKEIVKDIEDKLAEVIKVKQSYFEDQSDKSLLISEGRTKLAQLNSLFQTFATAASFLLPYGHPVDYLGMRSKYDDYKNSEEIEGIKIKNQTYFLRKIYEDGAYNPDHTRPDLYFRALLSTIIQRFSLQDGIINEDLRYDIDSFISQVERYIRFDVQGNLKRLNEWSERTQRTLEFYQKLISPKDTNYAGELLAQKSIAQANLIRFNLQKQRDVYKFWIEQNELYRALFVIETILFNEAGDIDGRDALERQDIVQVVFNRLKRPFYRSIPTTDPLYEFIKDLDDGEIQKYHWLNVMFKQGEFSFTYYFISSSRNIYCPDMSRAGRFLRNENLKIGLKKLNDPSPSFTALRYFSRASMLGRIDMSKVWTGFRPIEERPGLPTFKDRQLSKIYKKGDYLFLYRFVDDKGVPYQVVEIKDKPYSMRKDFKNNLLFYEYRNPHYFVFFEKR